MGHQHHTYEFFGSDRVVRPLYGYVTDLKDGDVPRWAKKPTLSRGAVIRLFDLDRDEFGTGDIPRRALPDGVSKNTGGRGPTRYTVTRDAYLEQHQDRIGTADDKYRYDTVRFEVNMRNSGVIRSHASRGATVPDDIQKRLSEIRDTPKWRRHVDGHHVNFTKWELAFKLGPRGGINDVHIEADLNH
ncbi:hypothetical protein [Salinibaculum rarum]|uniref:hypothetical protein n=1 Tax=Salinibaculum rarum TaxID=3058903 RepID=UPI00265EB297|nr:hypothetical protein [Salinibaculum sp. KK48]